MSYSSYLMLCYDMFYFYGPVLFYYLRKILYQHDNGSHTILCDPPTTHASTPNSAFHALSQRLYDIFSCEVPLGPNSSRLFAFLSRSQLQQLRVEVTPASLACALVRFDHVDSFTLIDPPPLPGALDFAQLCSCLRIAALLRLFP